MRDGKPAPLVFMDTETTGLVPGPDVIWEFAAVRENPDGSGRMLCLLVEHDEEAARSLPEPFASDYAARWDPDRAVPRILAAAEISRFFADKSGGLDPVIIGMVPGFDELRVQLLLDDFDLPFRHHYQLVDVEAKAAGYLEGFVVAGGATADEGFANLVTPPWDSDALSHALGVDPEKYQRHTAMGDVLWCRALYDAVRHAPGHTP